MANATATATVRLLSVASQAVMWDLATEAAALDAEANIDSAVVDPHGDTTPATTGDPTPTAANATPDNVADIVVVASHATSAETAMGYITAAIAAVASVVLVPFTGPGTLGGMKITADAPTSADDSVGAEEVAVGVLETITFTCTHDVGASYFAKYEVLSFADVAGQAGLGATFTDNGDNTASLAITAVTANVGLTYIVRVRATDPIGQTVDDDFTVTVVA